MSSRYFGSGIRVAAVIVAAALVGACSSGGGRAARSASPTTIAASSQHPSTTSASSTVPTTVARHSSSPGSAATSKTAVASPVVECGNHLRMGLVMTDPKQTVQSQVATFTAAVGAAPSWEVTAFREVLTQFMSAVGHDGKSAALGQSAFGYSAVLQLCTQSAPH